MMEKKLFAQKVIKSGHKGDGLKPVKLLPKISCLLCGNELSEQQKKDVLRGKMKGYCSKICFAKAYKKINEGVCVVCGKSFFGQKNQIEKRKVCSVKCAGVLASIRMTENNPMLKKETRLKVSDTLKKINHYPLIQGGNGRGATDEQLLLYNEINKIDGSFEMEVIEKTGLLRKTYKAPYHYKIDIASRLHNIAIEVNGFSHSSNKVKECDKRKKELLSLKGWKVLSFTNSQIKKELQNCVQTVLSMI